MTVRDPRAEECLALLKREGRSSPEGLAWQQFFEKLRALKRLTADDPPVPLILAASSESNRVKHNRLGAQLDWACQHGCLEEAIAALQAVPPEQWNTGSLDRWDKEGY